MIYPKRDPAFKQWNRTLRETIMWDTCHKYIAAGSSVTRFSTPTTDAYDRIIKNTKAKALLGFKCISHMITLYRMNAGLSIKAGVHSI